MLGEASHQYCTSTALQRAGDQSPRPFLLLVIPQSVWQVVPSLTVGTPRTNSRSTGQSKTLAMILHDNNFHIFKNHLHSNVHGTLSDSQRPEARIRARVALRIFGFVRKVVWMVIPLFSRSVDLHTTLLLLQIIKFVNFDDVGLYFEICIEKTCDFNVISYHFKYYVCLGYFSQYLYVAIIWANVINSKPEFNMGSLL